MFIRGLTTYRLASPCRITLCGGYDLANKTNICSEYGFVLCCDASFVSLRCLSTYCINGTINDGGNMVNFALIIHFTHTAWGFESG